MSEDNYFNAQQKTWTCVMLSVSCEARLLQHSFSQFIMSIITQRCAIIKDSQDMYTKTMKTPGIFPKDDEKQWTG